jgi:hypothetical protein
MRILTTLIALLLVGMPGYAQVIVDYAESPAATEAELFSRAVIVVRGRIQSRRVETPEQGPAMSVYSVRILELLKNDGRFSADGVIDVHREGGFDQKTAQHGFPAFEVNDEVVLFLGRARNGWYRPLNGPDGAFKLTQDGRTQAFGKDGEVSKRHDGRSVAEFMSELRKHKK